MLANLALTSVAMIKPLEETILMHELDAPAASARVPKRIIRFPRVSTDPANILLVFVIINVPRSRGRRSRGIRGGEGGGRGLTRSGEGGGRRRRDRRRFRCDLGRAGD